MKISTDSKDSFENLIVRFLRREASAGEIKILESWLKEDADHRRIFKEIQTAQENLPESKIGYSEIDQAWHRLSEKIQKTNSNDKATRRIYSVGDFAWYKVAAAFAILLLGSFGVWQYLNNPDESTHLATTISAGHVKREFVLPDGTTVWLNTHSTITYNTDFDKQNRNVTLEGEAFFDVTKTGTTFVVKARNLDVIVKGTRFNVNTLEDSETESATLEEGRIILKVKGRDKQFDMKPGQRLSFNRESNKITMKEVNPRSYSGWKEASLRFEKTSLGKILEKIEIRYQVVINVDPVIANRENLTMTIQDETLEEVLDLIKVSSSLQYEIHGNEVSIFE